MGVEAGIQSGAISGGRYVGGYFLSPLGKANMIIAGVFLVILLFISITQSVEQKSLYPLWHNTLERVVSADTHLGQAVDEVVAKDSPVKSSSFLSKSMPAYIWFWVKWWFQVISCFFMMYFFIWLIYGFWYALDNTSLIRNVLLTVVTFILISFFMGMVIFNMNLAGKSLPDNRQLLFQKQMQNSYPLHGTVKFFRYFVNKESLSDAYDWMNTGVGSAVTGYESDESLNESVNSTSVDLNLSGGS